MAPYLVLVRQDTPQRVHDLRKAFNALSRIMRALPRGCSRVTFHLEDRLISRPKDGWLPATLKRWWTTYGHC